MPHGRFVNVQIVGVDDATLGGLPIGTDPALAFAMRRPDAVLADAGGTHLLKVPVLESDSWVRGRPRLDASVRPIEAGDSILTNDVSVEVMGRVTGSPRFDAQPVLYTTFSNFSRVLPPQRHMTTFILAGVTSEANPASVARRIESQTGLRARTGPEFRADTVRWFVTNSGFVSHVGVMVFFAAAVGFTITALMLFLFTKENARHYAALIAIGAGSGLLMRMIFSQAAVACMVGFGLGLGLCSVMGSTLAMTEFPFRLMWYTPLGVAGLVSVVAFSAALLSSRTVLKLEPAIVFKG